MEKKKSSKSEERKIIKIVSTILICCVLFVIFFRWFITSDRKYNFVSDVLFPLWYVALGISVIGAIIFIWFSLKKISSGDKNEKESVIWMTSIMALLVFMMLGTLFAHLNHIFDPNEPDRYVVVIEDVRYNSGGIQSPGYYKFRVTINGEIENITVPKRHIHQFHEGDLYVVEYHKGAFNEPYYIGVGAP